MTDQQKLDRLIAFLRWVFGGLAAVAAFLLIQPEDTFSPAVRVALGAFLAFAAYADLPYQTATRLRPAPDEN